jgi:hypothetical protein
LKLTPTKEGTSFGVPSDGVFDPELIKEITGKDDEYTQDWFDGIKAITELLDQQDLIILSMFDVTPMKENDEIFPKKHVEKAGSELTIQQHLENLYFEEASKEMKFDDDDDF